MLKPKLIRANSTIIDHAKAKNERVFNNLISRNDNGITIKKVKAKNILDLLEIRSEAHRERESQRS